MGAKYKIWFDAEHIYLQDSQGKVGYLPLRDYKPLWNASNEEREEYELSPFGIHWAKLDEDLCFDGFIWDKKPKPYSFETEQMLVAAEPEFEYKTKK